MGKKRLTSASPAPCAGACDVAWCGMRSGLQVQTARAEDRTTTKYWPLIDRPPGYESVMRSPKQASTHNNGGLFAELPSFSSKQPGAD